MNIGATIADVRKRRKIGQRELAEAAGITVTFLSQIENGKGEPSMNTLDALGKALGTPVPILFFLSLREEDVPLERREAYAVLTRAFRSAFEELFFSNSDKIPKEPVTAA